MAVGAAGLMLDPSRVAGVVLAGGRSSRMGAEKALMAAAGPGSATLLERQAGLLRSIGLHSVILSLRRNMPGVAGLVNGAGGKTEGDVIVVHDEVEDLGPLSGIVAAMRVEPALHLLVLAVDMPLVDESLLRSMINMSTEVRGVVPIEANGWTPLCALYPPYSLSLATELLGGSDRTPRALVEVLAGEGRIRPLPLSPSLGRRMRSWNAPSDLPPIAVSG